MPSPFLAASTSRLPFRVVQASVRYASSRTEGGPDPAKELIRRSLYPPNIRNKPSPTGTWRPDVARAIQKAIPSRQAHETVERAWMLHVRHTRRKRDAELQRKYECMRKAMDALERIDPHLYKEANRVEDPRVRTQAEVELAKKIRGPERKALEARPPGLFPRELRAPTDTPPRNGWNYEWKPIIRAV
ncbi:hypothetical protein EWM64_g584 [Hericium alpestre]|uniref:Large ribosomal subunit protein mL40 n=1 Tax=Hericium alpestre TaxID=135208 RepID=A0A4Z0AAS4_9AGAM|nr:hypothetical protein EWM64_g584 [Hericium alpestre]